MRTQGWKTSLKVHHIFLFTSKLAHRLARVECKQREQQGHALRSLLAVPSVTEPQ
jgi:hypothetical protein